MYARSLVAGAIVALAPAWASAQNASKVTMSGDMGMDANGRGVTGGDCRALGDMAGPGAFLIRLPPGFDPGLHAHHSNYHGVVISGEHTHWDEGQDAVSVPTLGPGDSWLQPKEAFHGDANHGDTEVVGFVYFEGPVDSYVKE